MKTISFVFILLSSLNVQAKEITQNNMTIEWAFVENGLKISLTAPTNGWIACGFNTKSGLKGTNLLMCHVKNNKAHAEDHFIVAAGKHQTTSSLGGNRQIDHLSGSESSSNTSVSFILKTNDSDGYHHKLIKGKTYNVLLAYSQEDDFEHHSMMRTEVKIKL